MPEEINRIVADEFSDMLFVHCEEAVKNLRTRGSTTRASTWSATP